MVMWEILTRRIPFADHECRPGFIRDFRNDVLSGLRPSVPDRSPPEFVAIMEDCWQTDPCERPSFSRVSRRLETLQKANPGTATSW
jgi:hypothetical protein